MTAINIRSMQAAILTELNNPLVLDEVELPQHLDVGQVLVKILYSGICGSQIGEIQGVKGPDKYLPHLLGHEAVAEIQAIGPGVSQIKPKDTAILHWRKGSGIEAKPPSYKWNGKTLNAGALTTFNTYAIVSENRMTKLSESIAHEGASLLGCAVTTGYGAINNNAKLKIGESVLVLGAGGIGLNAIEGAHLSGAYPIIAVDLFPEKLEFAKKFGATHTVDSNNTNLQETIKKLLPQGYADVVVEITGAPQLIELAYAISGPQGRVVLVGVPKAGNNINIHSLPMHFGKTFVGCHGGDSNPSQDIPRYARLAAHGIIKLQELVTDVFEFAQIQTGIDRMIKGEIKGRCVIRF